MAERRAFAVAVVLAAMLRLGLAWRSETISVDGVQYLTAAQQFGQGAWAKGLGSFYPPGYPLAVAATYPLVGEWERAGLAVSVVAGVLALWPLAALTRMAGLEGPALVAALMAGALAPFPARYAASVRSEALYGLLLLAAVWAAAATRVGGRARHAVAAGMAAGLAYLVRPEGLFLVVPLAVGLGRPRRAVLLVATTALVALPYVLYLRHDTGRWLVSRKAANVLSLGIQQAVGEGGVVSQRASDATSLGDVLASRRDVLARKLARDGVRTFVAFADCLHWVPVPFVLLGIAGAWRARRPLEPLLHAVVWFYVAFFALVYVDRRFYTGIVPLALLWGGAGFAAVWSRLARRGRVWPVLGTAAIVATLLGKNLLVGDSSGWVRTAGAAIAQAGGGRSVVAVRDIRVAWYAGARWAALEFPLDAQQLLPLLDGGAQWLVVTEGDLAPDARVLLEKHGSRVRAAAAVPLGRGRGEAQVYRLGPRE
ncbi:MAG: hypothetical protein U0807_01665 [Candidatus Binatia bacterium]